MRTKQQNFGHFCLKTTNQLISHCKTPCWLNVQFSWQVKLIINQFSRQRGRGRVEERQISNEIRATIIDHVINHGLSMTEAGRRVQPNLGHPQFQTFRRENRYVIKYYYTDIPVLANACRRMYAEYTDCTVLYFLFSVNWSVCPMVVAEDQFSLLNKKLKFVIWS